MGARGAAGGYWISVTQPPNNALNVTTSAYSLSRSGALKVAVSDNEIFRHDALHNFRLSGGPASRSGSRRRNMTARQADRRKEQHADFDRSRSPPGGFAAYLDEHASQSPLPTEPRSLPDRCGGCLIERGVIRSTFPRLISRL